MRRGSRRKAGFSTRPVTTAVTTPTSPAVAGLLPEMKAAMSAATGRKTSAEFSQSRAVSTGTSSLGKGLMPSRTASA